MKLEFSPRIFEKYSDTKFGGNPASGSGAVSYGRTDRQTDIQMEDVTNLIVAFRNSANALKNGSIFGRIFNK